MFSLLQCALPRTFAGIGGRERSRGDGREEAHPGDADGADQALRVAGCGLQRLRRDAALPAQRARQAAPQEALRAERNRGGPSDVGRKEKVRGSRVPPGAAEVTRPPATVHLSGGACCLRAGLVNGVSRLGFLVVRKVPGFGYLGF